MAEQKAALSLSVSGGATSSSSASLAALETSIAASSTSTEIKKSPRDFIFLKTIGEGSFSTVYIGKEVDTNREFAIKVCEKRLIKKERKTAYVLREKDVMAILNKNYHPFFVRLYCTFQDDERLYFCMSLAKNGELLNYMDKLGSFDEDVTRFYAAEIVIALEHLHKLAIIHRDLKPENILLNEDMHIMISDFGSTKLNRDEDRPTPLIVQQAPAKRASFVGTAQYVSPEVLNGKPTTSSCDFWALGCLIYQMLAGLPPFRAANEYLIFQKIIKLDYSFPEGFPPVPKELVEGLLVLEPSERLGDERFGGVPQLKANAFFTSIDWQTLTSETPPAILPYLPASHGSQSYHSNYKVPDDVQPGLDDKQMTRLLGLQLGSLNHIVQAPPMSPSRNPQHILDLTSGEREKRLAKQKKENPYDRFVEGHLILKSGLLDKRKGLFARRRMFLLTEGPHLYYVDPANMEFKGQVPWSKEMRTEAKNFKIFFVHTPNRTYYLEDPNNRSSEWCEALEQVRHFYFADSNGGSSSPPISMSIDAKNKQKLMGGPSGS